MYFIEIVLFIVRTMTELTKENPISASFYLENEEDEGKVGTKLEKTTLQRVFTIIKI